MDFIGGPEHYSTAEAPVAPKHAGTLVSPSFLPSRLSLSFLRSASRRLSRTRCRDKATFKATQLLFACWIAAAGSDKLEWIQNVFMLQETRSLSRSLWDGDDFICPQISFKMYLFIKTLSNCLSAKEKWSPGFAKWAKKTLELEVTFVFVHDLHYSFDLMTTAHDGFALLNQVLCLFCRLNLYLFKIQSEIKPCFFNLTKHPAS